MSIILDALKKAETERHLGQLPGLHTPRSTTSEVQSAPAGARSRTVWYAVGLALVLMAIVATWWMARTAAPSDASIAPQVQPQPSRASAPAVQSMQPASAPLLPRIASAATTREIPVPPPLPTPVAKPAPTTKPMPLAAEVHDVQTRKIPAVAAPEKIMMLAELSPAMQRELPPLVIGGSMYSENAAERMLLVDKRLLHEGEEVAPNLVLEKLMPKAAILRFRGTRFRIAF